MKKTIYLLLIISGLILPDCQTGSESTTPEKDVYDVIIVGAGGGGMGAALELTRAGKKVLIIEQHYRPGGYMTNFSRSGYTFEVSLHAMDNLNPGRTVERFFKEIDIYDKLKPVKADPMYKACFPDNFDIVIPADVNEYKKVLAEKFPDQAESIEKFFDITLDIDYATDAFTYLFNGEYLEGLKVMKAWIAVVADF